MDSAQTSRQWKLVRRPTGWPVPEDFDYFEAKLRPLADGQVRVANDFISVDPYMRGRMNDVKSYIPPFTIVNYMQHAAAFATEAGPLVASGEFLWDETIVDGIDNALDAFYGLLRGANTGKMLVRTSRSD